MTRDTNTDADRIEQERACLHGHEESRQRLLDAGVSEHEVDQLEVVAHGYADFARCVVDEIRRA